MIVTLSNSHFHSLKITLMTSSDRNIQTFFLVQCGYHSINYWAVFLIMYNTTVYYKINKKRCLCNIIIKSRILFSLIETDVFLSVACPEVKVCIVKYMISDFK